MKKTILSLLFVVLCLFSVNGQTRLKVMFLNMLNYSNSEINKQKTPYAKIILNEMQPDLFMTCEVVNQTASDYLFTNAILPYNNNFNKAPFKYSQSTATGLHQTLYYNTTKFILVDNKVIPTGTRDINRYTLKIKTENSDTNPLLIEVFVTHLKASKGSENREKRRASVSKFIEELHNIPANSYVIFAGDFNFYTSNESGYQLLTKTDNPIVIVDPINRPCPAFPNNGVDYFRSTNYNATYFWNNSSFKDIHTQSTRANGISVIDNSGAKGGMDDRFDFIMMSKNFKTSNDLYYINGSYKAVGNNGNCYNSYISNTNCTGEFSQTLREAVLQISDHLPVIMEIEAKENLLSTNHISEAVKVIGKNIVTDQLFLAFKNPDVKKIYIYNNLGQLVISHPVKNSQKIRLKISHLTNGLYFLRTNKHVQVLKFIKSN